MWKARQKCNFRNTMAVIKEILRKSLKNTTEVIGTQTVKLQRAFTEFLSFQKEFTFLQEGCHLAPIERAIGDCDVCIYI